MQIFHGAETQDVQQAAALTETPNLLVPVRRIREVREDRMMEQSTADSPISLQQQLDERTAELEATKEQLANCNRDFQEFAAAVSHDLQTPLRAITGFSQFLQEEYGAGLDETADQYINHIIGGSARLRKLIEGLLHFSRVSSRSKPLENLSLNEVLDDVLADLQGEIDGQHVVIERADLPNVNGDYNQLRSLFKNLIQNGITFNDSNTPEVRVRAEQVDSDWHIVVEDNGIGIEEKNLEKVFAIFRRLHTLAEYDGVGAGLAVCRRIVNRHGGQIELSSELGVGTKAKIVFSNATENE